MFPELNRRLTLYHILLGLPFVYLENCFFVNCNCNLVLLKLRSKEVGKALAVLSVARVLIFLSCIVKELSLSTKFWKDDDLPPYATLNALSCMRFILLLRFRLWNIQTKGLYLNRDSLKVFIIILLLLTFTKGARRDRELTFLHAFLRRLLSWSSNLKFLFIIIIPRSTSSMLDSMEQPSITTVYGSLQLKERWYLLLLALKQLILNHSKGSCDDAPHAFIMDPSLFFNLLQYPGLQGNKIGHKDVH